MIVKASPLGSATTIEIDGWTQGLLGGTLRENVNGLRNYLLWALPEMASQYQKIKTPDSLSEPKVANNLADELEHLFELRKSGALSDQEFEQAKRKLLSE